MSLSLRTSLFFGYLFNETHHTSNFEFIQRRIFSFSQCSLCGLTFGIWVSSISQIMFLVFQRTTDNSLCVFILRRIKRQLLRLRSLKIQHVLAFWLFLPRYQSWSQDFLSTADPYIANREWGFPMPMSACINREGWRETAPLSTANSASRTCFPPQPG